MDDDRTLAGLAEGPLDDVDAATLDRVRFSLALEEMFGEVAGMTRVPLDAMATRSEPAQGTRTETLTFSADRLTAMVTVSRTGVGRLRLDGWLAPPEVCRVRLRMQSGGDHVVVSDAQGRFSFESLADGFGQLSFHPVGDRDADDPTYTEENAVVTPLFQL